MTPSPASDRIRVALTGAAGGFGRTVLLALRSHPSQRPGILCDLDTVALRRMLIELGYSMGELVECADMQSVRRTVDSGSIALVTTTELIDPAAYDVLVEATGSVGVSVRAALAAIDAGRPVVMVSKETESLFGRVLAERARDNGVVSTTGAGDQPANLVALLQWAQHLGLSVVAAGKSSEYDLVFDEAAGTASILDRTVAASGLTEHWRLGDDIPATLEARRALVDGLPLGAAADYCEIAVTANLTGLGVDTPAMHYPIVRYTELADVFRSRDEGGILSSIGVLDVFVLLRGPDEASFAGGEFIVVRCDDAEVARVLQQKGHVISRSADHLCIGLPYHLMGLEIPGTITDAVSGRPVADPAHARTAMVAVASEDLAIGTRLVVAGHHHEIAGVAPSLLPTADAAGLAPFYLLGGAQLVRDVAVGQPIRLTDVDGVDPELMQLAAQDLSIIERPKEMGNL